VIADIAPHYSPELNNGMQLAIAIIGVLLLAGQALVAQTAVTGKVIQVASGNTSRKKLADKLQGRVVQVTYFEKDRFNHITGTVNLDDRWINQEVLAEGCAWHDKRYSDDDMLDTAEQQARARHLGLWAEPNPMPPWEWRQTHQTPTPE